MIHVVTWYWGDRYPPIYIPRLALGVRKWLTAPHRFYVMARRDDKRDLMLPDFVERHAIKDEHYLDIKGCFARLRIFNHGWQRARGIEPGDRIIDMDLDAVVTGPLDHLLATDQCEFRIMRGYNTTNPCPYNGSLWSFNAYSREDVWTDFSLMEYARRDVPYHAFPDDQGWFHHKFPNAASYTPADGVYAFMKNGWPQAQGLPDGARFVAFPGWRDPMRYCNVPWVKQHWVDLSPET